MVKEKLIFLHSQSPRSGHNFMADVIRTIVDCKTPIDVRSELPIAPVLHAYHKAKCGFYKSKGVADYLDELFVKPLRATIMTTKDNYLIKYTSFTGTREALHYFPEALHVVSLRDPKDCLISYFKILKYNAKDIKSFIKKIVLPFGIYHYSYARKYSKRIEAYLPNLDDCFVVKYEDLVKRDEITLKRLMDLFEVSLDVNTLSKRIDGIDVINTSFFKEETHSDDMWKATKKTERFNPISRTYGFNALQLLGIKMGSMRLRRKMGYV
ncbi:sulfotransferase [Gaetbulibacter sp. PBL-D1]|uniref:sulfotransferase n=1 Tax=Gaetbulibacter sp. PBL-D1 TaxID=3422594 RepID=UPI003D2EEF53